MKPNHPGSLRPFLILWSTQSLSTLGSSMTAFALVLWSYQSQGSALSTALLSVCSYAPYVAMSIFAGALSDRWDKKRTMLVCDTLAARMGPNSLWALLFGTGKGSGAAGLFLVLGLLGVLTCLIFRRDRHIWSLEA